MKRWMIVLGLAFWLAGCASQPKEPEPELILRYADNQPQGYPTTLAAEYFAQLVQERTQGKILVLVYSDGELGDENSVLEQVQFGGIDFARVSLGTLSDVFPDAQLFQLPYLYDDADHMWRVLDGPIGDNFRYSVRQVGVIGLSWFDAGSRSFYTREQIEKLGDLQGMTIRVQESGFMSRMVELMGAKPIQLPYGEVYSALQTAKIDGAENNWPSYESTGHFEAAPYVLLDEHCRLPELQIMSTVALDKINQIDEDYVTIITQCARECAIFEREQWRLQETASRDAVLEKGCVVTTLSQTERERFRQAVQPIYEGYSDAQQALIQRIRES